MSNEGKSIDGHISASSRGVIPRASKCLRLICNERREFLFHIFVLKLSLFIFFPRKCLFLHDDKVYEVAGEMSKLR